MFFFYRELGNHSMIRTKKRNIYFHCTCRAIMNDCFPFEANAPCQVQLMVPQIPLTILLSRKRGGSQKEVRQINSKPLRRHPSKNLPTIRLNCFNLLQQQSSRHCIHRLRNENTLRVFCSGKNVQSVDRSH